MDHHYYHQCIVINIDIVNFKRGRYFCIQLFVLLFVLKIYMFPCLEVGGADRYHIFFCYISVVSCYIVNLLEIFFCLCLQQI